MVVAEVNMDVAKQQYQNTLVKLLKTDAKKYVIAVPIMAQLAQHVGLVLTT